MYQSIHLNNLFNQYYCHQPKSPTLHPKYFLNYCLIKVFNYLINYLYNKL